MNFKLQIKNIVSFGFTVGVILCSCILVRLPHFLSNDFFFDGDEGIVGIMAQDFLLCKGLPLYFYGQNYGFSSVEVLSTAFFIKILGTGIWALRLGGLLLFSIGLTFIWKTFELRKIAKSVSIICVLLLIMSPTWFLWGGMVRGGYVTAFMCFGILFHITQTKQFNWKWAIISAFISAIAYTSQPLIFVPMLPFLINWMLPIRANFKKIFGFVLLSFLAVYTIYHFGKSETVWSAPISTFFDAQQFDNLKIQAQGTIYGYSNFFFFTMNIPISSWWFVLLYVSLGLIALYIFLFYINSQTKDKKLVALMIGCLLLSIFLVSTVSMYSPRYWLGFFTGILFLFLYGILHGDFIKKRIHFLLSITLIYGMGLIAAQQMKRDWYYVNVNEMDAITTLYNEVKSRKIEAVFVSDPVLQWKWNYLFGREIPGTFFSKNERTNEFKDNVFEKYNSVPQKTAIIGLHKFYNGLEEFETFTKHCDQVATKYYIMDRVEKQFIETSMKKYN